MKLSAIYEKGFSEKSRSASVIQITTGNIWKKMKEEYTYKKETYQVSKLINFIV